MCEVCDLGKEYAELGCRTGDYGDKVTPEKVTGDPDNTGSRRTSSN